MRVKKKWSAKHNHQDVFTISLCSDGGVVINIINYGAVIKDILIPNVNNQPENLVLSYNTIEEYYDDPHYIGCVIGRYANRIAGAVLNINAINYFLSLNEAGNSNHLHGGYRGFNKKVWEVSDTFSTITEAGVILSIVSPHLDEGYPGKVNVEVTYVLSNANELFIKYKATTDQDTVINLTNHTYFNLSGGKRDISSCLLSINADQYTPTNNCHIPDGRTETVNNSVFDLRTQRKVADIMHKIPTINYCLNNKKEFKLAATLTDPEVKRTVEVRTTSPGLQLYCGNYLNGNFKPFSGICLEPHYYPDSPNHSEFPSTLLLKGQVYNETTSYKFL